MKGGEPIFIDNKAKVGVLMLHGFTSTPHQFRELSSYLSEKGFNVYAPLVAGHGTSPEDLLKTTPEDWDKSVMDAYLRLKEKSEKIVIIGNSFGGNLAFWLVKKLNNNIGGIVSLGTPIFLKYQRLIKLRYYTYGRFKKYYCKPARVYKLDYTDMKDEVTYHLIPIKSLMEFLKYIKKETIPGLKGIVAPILIVHADFDPVVDPGSANYIYNNLGSKKKEIFWFSSRSHAIVYDKNNSELFQKIYNFIKENTANWDINNK